MIILINTALSWIIFKIIALFYIPIYLYYSCKKKVTCPPIKDSLLILSASDLARKIRQKEISSTEVVKAYMTRIKEVNPFINAVVDERFEDALADANRVDEFIKIADEEMLKDKPLLGVPITIKCAFAIKGLSHHCGSLTRNVIADKDAVVVQKIKEAGAIPLVTSNIPEFSMYFETSNRIIGTTKNPYDINRTCGGSTGGEAALICCGASPMGIGTDLSGSLRLPSHYCGIYAHKFTQKLTSQDGIFPTCYNNVAVSGPLARYVCDLKLLSEILLSDNTEHSIDFQTEIEFKKVKIYYMFGIGSILMNKINSEVQECFQDVIDFFNSVCDEPCTKVDDIPLIKNVSFLASVKVLQEIIAKPLYPTLSQLLTCRSSLQFTTKIILFIQYCSTLLPKSLNNKIDKQLSEIKADLLGKLKNDGVFIFPSAPTEAPYHGAALKNLYDSTYMSIFNILEFPATQCPIKLTRNGLPIGLQIVAAPFRDNLTISVAGELEKKFGGWKPLVDWH